MFEYLVLVVNLIFLVYELVINWKKAKVEFMVYIQRKEPGIWDSNHNIDVPHNKSNIVEGP